MRKTSLLLIAAALFNVVVSAVVIYYVDNPVHRAIATTVIALCSAVITARIAQELVQRKHARHIDGVRGFLEMIKSAHVFTYHGIRPVKDTYQLEWGSEKLNATIRLQIDGTSAWCQFQTGGEKTLKFKGSPVAIASYIREQIESLDSSLWRR